jgi:hypothetical protein
VKVAGPSGLQRLAVALAIFVFALQSYVIGSHVHPLPASHTGSLSALPHAAPRTPAHPSKGDDPANCPICQDLLLYGSYVLPAVVVLPLPDVVAAVEAARQPRVAALAAASHSWQSRAPPRI